MFSRILLAPALGLLLVLPMTDRVMAEGGHAAKSSYAGGAAMGKHHQTAGHMIRHLLKHQKEIGLSPDQIAKLKTLQMDLTRSRIRAEADIQVADAELGALEEDEKADFGALEAKVKQSEALRSALRLTVIKTKRDVLAVLTPEQRDKQKTEHEKMLHEMRGDHRRGHGRMKDHSEMGPVPDGTPHGAPFREKKEEPKQ
jgi:Spy/CpxP family protein refolding chaperone